LLFTRRYGTHMNCPVTAGLATFGKPAQPLERAGEPSDSRFGRRVSDRLVLCQL
jgi:hypothetical protein